MPCDMEMLKNYSLLYYISFTLLDPISERDLYELFVNSFQGDIGILITHRLGGAKNADEIMVISGGRVCERGTHNELIMCKGKYSEMYERGIGIREKTNRQTLCY